MSLISRIQMEAWWNGQISVFQKALSEGDLSVIPDLYSVFGSSHGTRSEAHEDDPRVMGMALMGLCDHVGQVRRAAEVGRLPERCEKEGRIRGNMAERVRFCL